jgi:hypothetical protein
MAATNPGFEVVGGTETEERPVAAPDNGVAIAMLTVALKALSQRALVAATDLFTLITCLAAWYLWYLTPAPTDRQIISLSIYALFTLAANYIVRRK